MNLEDFEIFTKLASVENLQYERKLSGCEFKSFRFRE
jgi:hypothetical protein